MNVLLNAIVIAVLVAANAFFVAAEYSLLTVRRTRIEELAAQGNASARVVLKLLADVGQLFSGIQLGVTAASLLMGWFGERLFAAALEPVLSRVFSRYPGAASHTIGAAIAFLLMTGFLMVLGELVPKALAYERAERVAGAVARPLYLLMRAARYPVAMLNELSNLVLRGLGHSRAQGRAPLHTPDEVKLIVSAIRKGGLLDREQEEMIRGVFDLHRARVREIMVPWPRLTLLPVESDLTWLLDQIVKDQHSRIPIYQGTPDRIVGILYTKDLLGVLFDRLREGIPLKVPLDLKPLLHQPMIVPEPMPLNQMLEDARAKQVQMALVVDEFGTYTGLVTIEDVLEEIVGEIQDEYDREEKAVQKVSESVLLVNGALGLRELADDYGIQLPRHAGYETLAGFVLARFGSIPRGGESFVFEGRRYTVAEMEGRRVTRVKVEKPDSAASQNALAEPGRAQPPPA